MFILVNYKYSDLYNQHHIGKQIEIVAVDMFGYGIPGFEVTWEENHNHIGKIYIDLETNDCYKLVSLSTDKIEWLPVERNYVINFKNKDIYYEKFELTESLCSDSELRFGSCEASMIKFRIRNNFVSLKNMWIVILEILGKNESEPFRFGIYKVYNDKTTADRKQRDITAYDIMYDILNADVSGWYNSIFTDNNYITMEYFRSSFLEFLGIEQEDKELANDTMEIRKTLQPETSEEVDGEETKTAGTKLYGKEVISAICEINGCFGHIGRNGKFNWIYLRNNTQGIYPANDLFPEHAPEYMFQSRFGSLYPKNPDSTRIEKGKYIKCDYEDYITKRIDSIKIIDTESEIGLFIGEGSNIYEITDNFLIKGKLDLEILGIANSILEKIGGIIYRPFSAECVGNPCLEVGDPVRINTKYELIESYILKRTLKGIQALKDSYSASGIEKYYGINSLILKTRKYGINRNNLKYIREFNGNSEEQINEFNKKIEEQRQEIDSLKESISFLMERVGE